MSFGPNKNKLITVLTHSRNLRRRFPAGARGLLRRILARARRHRRIIRRGSNRIARRSAAAVRCQIGPLLRGGRCTCPVQAPKPLVLGRDGAEARFLLLRLETPPEFPQYAALPVTGGEEVDTIGSELIPARLGGEVSAEIGFLAAVAHNRKEDQKPGSVEPIPIEFKIASVGERELGFCGDGKEA